MRIVRIFQAIALQRAQIVGVTELVPDRFERSPIMLGLFGAHFHFEMTPQVGRHPVVIEQRVIDVEKNYGLRLRHLTSLSPC